MDGMETTRQIRALGGGYGSLPIIAMTANVLTEQVVRYLAAGMNDHVAKPIDTRRLLQVLATWTSGAAPPASLCKPQPDLVIPHVTHDLSVWEELVEMLGRERVHGFAETLHTILLEDWADDGCRGAQGLAAAAHACVALAGQLGFGALSAASRNLETACLSEKDIQSALDAFGSARLDASIVLERLLADPISESSARVSHREPTMAASTA
jgi:hypothetical protein